MGGTESVAVGFRLEAALSILAADFVEAGLAEAFGIVGEVLERRGTPGPGLLSPEFEPIALDLAPGGAVVAAAEQDSVADETADEGKIYRYPLKVIRDRLRLVGGDTESHTESMKSLDDWMS